MKNYPTEKIQELRDIAIHHIYHVLEQGMFRIGFGTYEGELMSIFSDSCKNLDCADLLTCRLSPNRERCSNLINQRLKRRVSNWNQKSIAEKICRNYKENEDHSTKDYDSLLSKIVVDYVAQKVIRG
jgi:hypothetical protein